MVAMRNRWGLLLVVLLVVVHYAVAEDAAQRTGPTTAPSAASAAIDSLVAQLSSPDWRVREAANTSIVELGDVALQPMQQLAANSADSAMRERAHAVVYGIELARQMQPTRLSLHFDKASAKDVYAALSAQSGTPWIVNPAWATDPVTIALDNVPLWQAIDRLADQTDLMVEMNGREMTLAEARHDARGKRIPVSISGPYMVIAHREPVTDIVRELAVFVDPRLTLLSCAMEPWIDKAIERGGQPAVIHQIDTLVESPSRCESNGVVVRINPTVAFSRMRGTVRALIATRVETIQFNQIAQVKHAEQKIGTRKVVMNVITYKPEEWMVYVTATNTDPPTPGAVEMRIKVLDAAGSRIGGYAEGGFYGPKGIEWKLGITPRPNVAPADKLVLTFALETQEVQIPFEFEFP